MTVITVYEDGSPFFGGVVEARDLDGIQRAFSDANDENPEYLTLPVWMGETYVVQAAHLEIQSDLTPDNRFLFKSSEWRGETGPVQVNDQEMQVQVVMKLKSE